MTLNGYDSAFEQATNERAEVRIEIEKLLNRGELLDKLLESLAPFVTSPEPVEASEELPAETEQHHEHHENHEHQEQQS